MNMNYKKLLTIVFASAFLALSYNFLSPSGLSLVREETIVKNVTTIDYGGLHNDNDESQELNGIEFPTMVELWNDKRAVIIDARDQWEHGEGHIPGAISIPEFSFDPNDEAITNLNKDSVYVVYCEGDDCDVSKRLAKELVKLGFKKVYVYLGGYAEWIQNDMQVEVSK